MFLVDAIPNKINTNLSVLRQIKSFLILSVRIIFFDDFVSSLFDFADVISDNQDDTYFFDGVYASA